MKFVRLIAQAYSAGIERLTIDWKKDWIADLEGSDFSMRYFC